MRWIFPSWLENLVNSVLDTLLFLANEIAFSFPAVYVVCNTVNYIFLYSNCCLLLLSCWSRGIWQKKEMKQIVKILRRKFANGCMNSVQGKVDGVWCLAKRFREWLQWSAAVISCLKPVSAFCSEPLQLLFELLCIHYVPHSTELHESVCDLMT